MRHSFGVGSRNLTARCESSITGKGHALCNDHLKLPIVAVHGARV
jgi:hypothetical protein